MTGDRIRIEWKPTTTGPLTSRRRKSSIMPSGQRPGLWPHSGSDARGAVHRSPQPAHRQEVREQFEMRTHKRVIDIFEPTRVR